MRSIATKFSLAVVAFAVVFSGVILYAAWSYTRGHVEEMAALHAALAVEFDVALREYAAEAIRPEIEKRIPKDDFILEAMSTSYMARKIFEKVRRSFPDYVIKFSSDNPRNPDNRAGPEEMELLAYFRRTPEAKRWTGHLEMNGSRYFAHANAMRVDSTCLRCHGRPEDSPKSLLNRYGKAGGFGWKVADVAGLEVVAIPMDKIHSALRAQATRNIVWAGLCLVVLFGAILAAFRWMVSRRLAAITRHFQQAGSPPGGEPFALVPEQGQDEIAALAHSFNALATRLRDLHHSLEDRVQERTAELEKEHEILNRLLQTSDHERRVLAYEIHDGLAQELTGAIMQLETAEHLRGRNSEESTTAFQTGLTMLHHSLAEARRLINGVRPPVLDEFGVVTAIEHLIQDRLPGDHIPPIEFHHEVAFDRLAPVLENAIYRIVQEGLTNALQHSKCDKVRIGLVEAGQCVRIEIADDGIGFTADAVAEGRFGLEGIRERARLLDGTVAIQSAPGEGTQIVVELPLTFREAG